MKTIASFFIILLALLTFSRCVMPEEYLKKTELQENEEVRVIYKGNEVWLEPKHSPNQLMYDARMVYKMKKIKGGYAPKKITSYDSTFNLIKSETQPAIILNKYSLFTSRRVITKYFDNKKNLMEPEFMDYATMKFKEHRDGSFTAKYYDKFNKPSCRTLGYKEHFLIVTTDTIIDGNIVQSSNINFIYVIDCKGDTIKSEK